MGILIIIVCPLIQHHCLPRRGAHDAYSIKRASFVVAADSDK